MVCELNDIKTPSWSVYVGYLLFFWLFSNGAELSGLHGFPAPGTPCRGYLQQIWRKLWGHAMAQNQSWKWCQEVQETGPVAGGRLLDPHTSWHPHSVLPLGGWHCHTLGQTAEEKPLVCMEGSWFTSGRHTVLVSLQIITDSFSQNFKFCTRKHKPEYPLFSSITVVQSYFVYWAGIESGLVRDAGRRLWNGSNTTGVNGVSAISTLLQDKVTALPSKLI